MSLQFRDRLIYSAGFSLPLLFHSESILQMFRLSLDKPGLPKKAAGLNRYIFEMPLFLLDQADSAWFWLGRKSRFQLDFTRSKVQDETTTALDKKIERLRNGCLWPSQARRKM